MSAPDYERLADRLNDAWAVLRCVPARDGEAALRTHGIEYDETRGTGTRDGLDDDVLEAARILRGIPALIDRVASETQDHTG